ncbi:MULTISPECIES: twin-arginine translocase TatA/TatE family subunit [Legionella]|uniref:Preprotein translocase subunit TatB n=1 Tax=Legionella septentrionalis TaxID=2498109 RepID=A0A433JIB9_9GAMM|nr:MULTISPECIES: twin-arginine translocase TatA/TatE family subunit [Legionella]MCP0914931.1 twin-arginine translocase TatA/TatE family subunit [Legionella sp. 27cVA30]RUQ85024.1 preprotein translocase subunit TatB [Legionella septentrionalis]RUQ95640.1 preprotein translocase subunit TatB [Legionella septentrionalis]RUR09565.1 preprotein translocase subunit TatB [Legionella septentrionalis]RUR13868.1 preprotein translocase subunit TatB [Legionella septentrionalis]
MSTGELLLILIVALLVFGPGKMPMLAQHLGKCVRLLQQYRQQILEFWQAQMNEQQLQDNLKKAEEADKKYQLEDKASGK